MVGVIKEENDRTDSASEVCSTTKTGEYKAEAVNALNLAARIQAFRGVI
jgi:hypothetical protein